MATIRLPASLRLGLRHIYLPDLPPHYAHVSLAVNIRDILEEQIRLCRERNRNQLITPPVNKALPQIAPSLDDLPPSSLNGGPGLARPSQDLREVSSWLERTGPPPTILSFTQRPTYMVPEPVKTESESESEWESAIQRALKTLREPLLVSFPKPPTPEPWPTSPWLPLWKQKSNSDHDILLHLWEPVAISRVMPSPLYLGPGQIQIWTVMDFQDEVQRGPAIKSPSDFERILEVTTMNVLGRDFGINCFTQAGQPGVYVRSSREGPARRIATIYIDERKITTRYGVSIHVAPTGKGHENPWQRLGQAEQVTSILEEVLRHEKLFRGEDGQQSMFFKTIREETSAQVGQNVYLRYKMREDQAVTAPLGMDNRQIAAAWSYELACQLGMETGFLDHYGGSGWHHTDVGTRFTTTYLPSPPEVPSLTLPSDPQERTKLADDTIKLEREDGEVRQPGPGEKLVSWPLFLRDLKKCLHESIQGDRKDTRLNQYTGLSSDTAPEMKSKDRFASQDDLSKKNKGEKPKKTKAGGKQTRKNKTRGKKNGDFLMRSIQSGPQADSEMGADYPALVKKWGTPQVPKTDGWEPIRADDVLDEVLAKKRTEEKQGRQESGGENEPHQALEQSRRETEPHEARE